MLSNATLAYAIAQAQIGARAGFQVEQIDRDELHVDFDGVTIWRSEEVMAVVHLYLNDEDHDRPTWLVECSAPCAEDDVRPLTADSLERGLQFLLRATR
jgi:hypothetical protein